MNHRHPRSATVTIWALGAIVVAAACADSSESSAPPNTSPVDSTDASTLRDAGGDTADADAAVADASDASDGSVPTCSEEGWCRTALPTNDKPMTLVGVWGDGEAVVWAVSKEGDILRWDGHAWSVARAGTDQLYSVWGSSPTDLWVTSASGLLHGQGSSSASLTWTLTPLDTLPGYVPTILTAVGGTSATDVWVAGGSDFYGTVCYDYSEIFGDDSFNYCDSASFGGVGRVLRYLGPNATPAWALETELSSTDFPDGPVTIKWDAQVTFAAQPKWDKIFATREGVLYLSGSVYGTVPRLDGQFSLKRRVVDPGGARTWVEMFNAFEAEQEQTYNDMYVNNHYNPDACQPWFNPRDGRIPYLGTAAYGDHVWLTGPAGGVANVATGTFDPAAKTTTWSCRPFGFSDTTARRAVWASGSADVWSVGDLGRVSHYDGDQWKTSAITPTPTPILNDLRDVWGDDGELWAVGDGIALRKLRTP